MTHIEDLVFRDMTYFFLSILGHESDIFCIFFIFFKPDFLYDVSHIVTNLNCRLHILLPFHIVIYRRNVFQKERSIKLEAFRIY